MLRGSAATGSTTGPCTTPCRSSPTSTTSRAWPMGSAWSRKILSSVGECDADHVASAASGGDIDLPPAPGRPCRAWVPRNRRTSHAGSVSALPDPARCRRGGGRAGARRPGARPPAGPRVRGVLPRARGRAARGGGGGGGRAPPRHYRRAAQQDLPRQGARSRAPGRNRGAAAAALPRCPRGTRGDVPHRSGGDRRVPRAERRRQDHHPEDAGRPALRSEEHTSELQSLAYLVCRLLLEKKKKTHTTHTITTLH